MKHTLTNAWDECWQNTTHVHLAGTGLEGLQTDSAKVVARALGELSKMKLPIRAISCIDHAVRKAYECGRQGSMKSPTKNGKQS